MTAELSTDELLAVTALPLGTPTVRGLPTHAFRHMPVPASVPSQGIVIGKSTLPGPERLIALDNDALVRHVYVGGANGTGKTTIFVNAFRQLAEAGSGAIIIEYDGNLIQRTLAQVPAHRLDDVIVIDFANQRANPVGLNIIKLSSGTAIAGQLTALFESIYPSNQSIYSRKLLAHILPALEVVPNATLADVMVVANPKKGPETQWVNWIISQQRDARIKEFLADWMKLPEPKRAEHANVLDNRIWEVLTPRESRYMVNQETSSFQPRDVISGNRLLFVNFAGVPEGVASIIGSFIVSSLWEAARAVTPTRPNIMFLDEFQLFSRLNNDFEDMLATARKRKLGLFMATQYIERLDSKTKDAISANARTKVIFESSPASARFHSTEFADRSITPEQLQNMPAYTTLARINTRAGASSPITMTTFDDPPSTGLIEKAIELSDQRYGRSIESIETAERARRRAPSSPPDPPHKAPGDAGTF
ncbi:type IV secretory system conjugative DNA transfer family protein [Rhodococcus aetherivorans]